MQSQKFYITCIITVLIYTQIHFETYALEIDPNKEVLSRDKKKTKTVSPSKKSKSTETEKNVPSPRFLGEQPANAPGISDNIKHGEGKSENIQDNEEISKSKESSIKSDTKSAIKSITKTVKKFLGLNNQLDKENDDKKNEESTQKENKEPKSKKLKSEIQIKEDKKENKTNKHEETKKDATKKEVSTEDLLVEVSRPKPSNIKISIKEYITYFTILESYIKLFQVHDFELEKDPSKVDPKNYAKIKSSIQKYLPVIFNLDHFNDLSNLIKSEKTNKEDFEKIFITAQYIKFILKLTQQYMETNDYLYKSVILVFPDLYSNVKKIHSSNSFIKGKEFTYRNQKYDVFIKRNKDHKIKIDDKIIKKIKEAYNSSNSIKYLQDNLGVITHTFLLPYKGSHGNIKYLIYINTIELDDKGNVKNNYSLYLLPKKSYNFDINHIHEYFMLQDIADKLQHDILDHKEQYKLDPSVISFLKEQNNNVTEQSHHDYIEHKEYKKEDRTTPSKNTYKLNQD